MNFGASKGKRIGIIQSNYIPWKGYFDFIDSVDEFVLYDCVQYTRRDWRNRNKVKTHRGLEWLTIPVEVKGKYFQSVDETKLAGRSWIAEHLNVLRHCYGRAAHFRSQWEWVEQTYRSCEPLELLSDVNARLIKAIAQKLGIGTPIRNSREFEIVDGRSERLIGICKQAGASQYLSGPAAREYIETDSSLWAAAGITVLFKSYAGYPEYPQISGPFEHGVTILDVIFNVGDDARKYFKSSVEVEPRVLQRNNA